MHPTFKARRATYGSLGCKPQVGRPPKPQARRATPAVHRLCLGTRCRPAGLGMGGGLDPGVRRLTPGYPMPPYRARFCCCVVLGCALRADPRLPDAAL